MKLTTIFTLPEVFRRRPLPLQATPAGAGTLPPGWQPASLTPSQLAVLEASFAGPAVAPLTRGALRILSHRLSDCLRTLPGALSGRWSVPGGAVARLQAVCAALDTAPGVTTLPPVWQAAARLVVCARVLQILHGVQVEFQDGHLWDPLAGPPSRPWRWRFCPARYPDSDWQEAFWITLSLIPENLMSLLKAEKGVWPALFSALTQGDNGEEMLSRLAEVATQHALGVGMAADWPQLDEACQDSLFTGTALSPAVLSEAQKARLARLDRESGMSADVRLIWNTGPLTEFLTLAQTFPASAQGPYSEPGGLATLICDALQVAVRIRKACALPADEPEEQMRQGEAWNTAVWFVVLLEGLTRLHQFVVTRRTGQGALPWTPDEGPLPEGATWQATFRACPQAHARAVHTLTALMPPGLLSWFRPFPLLYRSFTGALAGHTSGELITRIAGEAIQKASAQWQRDRGQAVPPDAGQTAFTSPASPQAASPSVATEVTPPPVATPVMSGPSSPGVSHDEPATVSDDQSLPVSSSPSAPCPPATGTSSLEMMLGVLAPSHAASPPSVTPDVTGHPECRDADTDAEDFVAWLRTGLADGTLSVNQPDAMVHVWSAHFVFIECPAIVRRWTAARGLPSEEQEARWRRVLRSLRNTHFFHDAGAQLPAGRIMSAGKKPYRDVKGQFVEPCRIFDATALPLPGNCFTLKKKSIG